MNGENQQQTPANSGWQFKPDQAANPASPAPGGNSPAPQDFMAPANDFAPALQSEPIPEVSWSASEFVAHEKSLNWYLGFAAAIIIITAIVYVWTRDALSAIAVIVVSVLFGIIAARKPRVVEYHLTNDGIVIGTRAYHYSEFKSFGVLEDGAFTGIVFSPLKRFMPPLTIYYPPDEQEKIAYVLSSHLPYAPPPTDSIDRLLRSIHF